MSEVFSTGDPLFPGVDNRVGVAQSHRHVDSFWLEEMKLLRLKAEEVELCAENQEERETGGGQSGCFQCVKLANTTCFVLQLSLKPIYN